jgi:hypothetical protein
MRNEHQALLNDTPMTPTTKSNTILGATRNIRKIIRLTEADEIWGELEDDTSKSPSPGRPSRRASHNLPPPAIQASEPDENTSLLRSNTNRKRRRRSTGFPGFTSRPSPRAPKRRGTHLSQDAVGGFWKMRWWSKKDGSGKGPPDSSLGQGGAESSGSAII